MSTAPIQPPLWDRPGVTKAEALAIIAVLSLLLAMLLPVFLPRDREKANLAACRENLRAVGAGLLAYAQSNGGKLPLALTIENPHLELTQTLVPGHVADPKFFYCPSQTRLELSYSPTRFQAGTIGYFYYGAAQASTNENLSKFLLTGITWPRELDTTMDKRSWIMSDIWVSGDPTAHAGYRKGVNYLMLDGSVDFVAESPRQAFH